MSMVTALDLFPVSIIHLNDMHARFDETNMFSNTCKSGDHCIGGFARVVSKVKELLVSRASKNPIYLNAADYYQGTIWYNLFKWNVTSYFLNMDPIPDAIVSHHLDVFPFNKMLYSTRQLEITSLTMVLLGLFHSCSAAGRQF